MEKDANTIKTRSALEPDLAAILELDSALFQFDHAFDPSLDLNWTLSPLGSEFYLDRILNSGVVILAEDADGSTLGFITGGEADYPAHRTPCRMAELDTFFVIPQARGRSVGHLLFTAFQNWCDEQGYERLSVRVSAGNANAIQFYHKHGFSDYDLILERPIRLDS